MSLVDRPQTPVCVVVGTGTGTERAQCPQGSSLPVLVVMGEASQTRHAARVIIFNSLKQFAQFLLASLLSQQPQPVFLLEGFLERMKTRSSVSHFALVF